MLELVCDDGVWQRNCEALYSLFAGVRSPQRQPRNSSSRRISQCSTAPQRRLSPSACPNRGARGAMKQKWLACKGAQACGRANRAPTVSMRAVSPSHAECSAHAVPDFSCILGTESVSLLASVPPPRLLAEPHRGSRFIGMSGAGIWPCQHSTMPSSFHPSQPCCHKLSPRRAPSEPASS